VLTVLFATTTAALFGGSDFLGGLASRRVSALLVTSTAHALAVVVLGIAALVSAPLTAATPADLAWGAVAGVSGGLGVTALYAALASGRMSVVAPIAAAISGSLPAAFDVLRGSRLSLFDWVGITLALVAVVLVSTSGGAEGEREMPRRALLLAFVAGVGFAGSWLSFAMTTDGSGFWPLASARLVSAVLIGGLALASGRGLLARGQALRLSFSAGALDAFANLTMITAIREGPLAVASVLGSLYPVTTVLLAYVVLRERVTRLQALGIVLALAAVVLTALP
jgi:drug/metabolite transporter (DMT)-like permease